MTHKTNLCSFYANEYDLEIICDITVRDSTTNPTKSTAKSTTKRQVM